MPRTDVNRYIWQYIRDHELQNPDNRREILPNPALAEVLQTDGPVHMLALPGLLNPHLHRP